MLRCQNRFKCFLVSHFTSCRHGSCFKYCCAHICILVLFACVSFYTVYMFQVCTWKLGIHLLQKHHRISQNVKEKDKYENSFFTKTDVFCQLEPSNTLFPLTFKGPCFSFNDISAFKPEKHFFSSFTDQTPTPTRFLKNCEEVGLFSDLDCSIEQEFCKAQEEEDSKQVLEQKAKKTSD